MSIQAMNWAWGQQLSGNEKLTLMALADIADDDGSCWPSYSHIAEKCCYSRATAMRMVASLEKQKFLKIFQRQRDNGSLKSNLIVLDLIGELQAEKGDEGGCNLQPGGSSNLQPGSSKGATRVVAGVQPLEPPYNHNSLSLGETDAPPDDFQPNENTLIRMKMGGIREPTAEDVFNFVTYYQSTRTNFRVRCWQKKFISWMQKEKVFRGRKDAGNKQNFAGHGGSATQRAANFAEQLEAEAATEVCDGEVVEGFQRALPGQFR